MKNHASGGRDRTSSRAGKAVKGARAAKAAKSGKLVRDVRAGKAREAGRAVKVGRAVRTVKADAELLRQIEAAAGAEGLVQAVFMLRLPPGRPPAPRGIEKTARQVLNRVSRAVGTAATDFNVFGNLGAFALRAAPAFVHALLRAPEVVSAVANRRPEEVLVRPPRKRDVDWQDAGKQARPRTARPKSKPAASPRRKGAETSRTKARRTGKHRRQVTAAGRPAEGKSGRQKPR